MESRYDYVPFVKTRERADELIEDMFANGEVSWGERPEVEPIKEARPGKPSRVVGYKITLLG